MAPLLLLLPRCVLPAKKKKKESSGPAPAPAACASSREAPWAAAESTRSGELGEEEKAERIVRVRDGRLMVMMMVPAVVVLILIMMITPWPEMLIMMTIKRTCRPSRVK